MFEWLQLLYAICTSGEPSARWREIAFAANLATALAYFWIPAVMAVVFLRWKEELPYRWLWIGLVVFITACGLSHVMHALHVLRATTPHSRAELAILVGTAAVSLATAAGFTVLMPRILALASPAAAKRKMEAAIESATADLQSALEYQRLLLLEVHHRVKNNLQVIASLVGLHMRRAAGDRDTGLNDLRDRISAIASVHGQLEEVGADSLQVLPFLKALAGSIATSHGGSAVIEVRGDDFSVPLDHATSFALITYEAMKNAIEHAYPSGTSAVVEVVVKAEGRMRSFAVCDAGIGMDLSGADGIGSTLIKALAVQLGASVNWEARSQGGTRFILQFDEQPLASRIIANASLG